MTKMNATTIINRIDNCILDSPYYKVLIDVVPWWRSEEWMKRNVPGTQFEVECSKIICIMTIIYLSLWVPLGRFESNRAALACSSSHTHTHHDDKDTNIGLISVPPSKLTLFSITIVPC